MEKSKKQDLAFKFLILLSSIFMIVGLVYNKVLPTWISNTIKFGVLVILLACLFLKTKKFIIITLSIVMVLSSSLLIYSQYSLNTLINREPTETNIITFVVLKDSPINTLLDIKNSKIGMPVQLTEEISTYIRDYLNQKVAPVTISVAEDDLSNLNQLYAKTIDVMVLDNSMRDTLIESDSTFEVKTKTIWTIEKETIKEEIAKEVDTANQSFIVLVSGVDTRGTGPINAKARSDVNILMVINPTTRKMLMISIPRDTYVALACKDGALDKLTHSGNYGVNCTVKTIEDLFKININYYVKVSFTSFLKTVNVLGDIEVYSKYAFKVVADSKPPHLVTIKEGMNLLDADEALAFSRERYSFSSGDFQRGLNQQEVIKAIIRKATEPQSLLKIGDLVKVVSNSIETNLSNEGVMAFVSDQINDNRAWEFTSEALIGKGDLQPTYSMGSQLLYVSWPDLDLLEVLKTKIKLFTEEKLPTAALPQ